MPPIPPRVTDNFVLLSYKALLIGAELRNQIVTKKEAVLGSQ
jgi:hypothetical protein